MMIGNVKLLLKSRETFICIIIKCFLFNREGMLGFSFHTFFFFNRIELFNN